MLTTTETEETKSKLLDTRIKPHIRVINGALDDDPQSPHGIVLAGRIDTQTLRFLKVDQGYQRPLADRKDVWEALKSGKVVPTIEVGVRGQDFASDGDDYVINDPAYIIDGWQRVGTALRILEDNPHQSIRIFGVFHFGTDDLWERHRFTDLNKNVRKVSPNLHLRNMRDQSHAVLTLFGLSHNTKDFPLYKKVCWSQNMRRTDLLTARLLMLSAVMLHRRFAFLGAQNVPNMAAMLDEVADKIGLQVYRKNVSKLYETINACWPFNLIEYRHAATQTKTGFLVSLAKMFALHENFWRGNNLMIPTNQREKLAKFPIHDPHVVQLAAGGGSAKNILYDLLISHMNSGRRINRLVPRSHGNGRA